MKNSSLTEIYKWREKFNLNRQNIYNVLLKMYRRVNMFQNGDYQANLIIPAYPSEVKAAKNAGYLVCSHTEEARIVNWYKLTPKGVKVMLDLDSRLTWNEGEMNMYIFNLKC